MIAQNQSLAHGVKNAWVGGSVKEAVSHRVDAALDLLVKSPRCEPARDPHQGHSCIDVQWEEGLTVRYLVDGIIEGVMCRISDNKLHESGMTIDQAMIPLFVDMLKAVERKLDHAVKLFKEDNPGEEYLLNVTSRFDEYGPGGKHITTEGGTEQFRYAVDGLGLPIRIDIVYQQTCVGKDIEHCWRPYIHYLATIKPR